MTLLRAACVLGLLSAPLNVCDDAVCIWGCYYSALTWAGGSPQEWFSYYPTPGHDTHGECKLDCTWLPCRFIGKIHFYNNGQDPREVRDNRGIVVGRHNGGGGYIEIDIDLTVGCGEAPDIEPRWCAHPAGQDCQNATSKIFFSCSRCVEEREPE